MSQQLTENNQMRQFASPSLTPSQQYRMGELGNQVAPGAAMPHQMAETGLPSNNIIFNINGNTHINNFHHHMGSQYQNGMIQGRKVDVENPQLRFGKEDSSQSMDGPVKGKVAQKRQNDQNIKNLLGNQGGKTMISKKLLNQAKSAKLTRVTPKGLMRGQGKGLSGEDHQLRKSSQNAKLSQTGRIPDGMSAKNQFELNFNSQNQNARGSGQGNVTIDYDPQHRRGTLAPSGGEGVPGGLSVASGRNVQTRRQSSYSFNNLQSLVAKQQGVSQSTKGSHMPGKGQKPTAKSSRSKQGTNMTKHRRHKSEVKRGYQQYPSRPATKINSLLKGGANTSKIGHSKTGKQSEHNKENLNATNNSSRGRDGHAKMASTSQHSRGATQTVAYKSYHQRLQGGLSISSISSNSNRGNAGQSQAGSSRNNSKQRQQHATGSIADQLSKSYFLNTKQLLRHLSPGREREADQSQINSGLNSGMSHRQQPSRGRNRSTAVAKASGATAVKTRQRKTHSHSQTKTNNNQLSLRQNPPATSIPSGNQAAQIQITDQKMVSKSKSTNINQSNQYPVSQNKINKMAVDKLIKENLRKNKNKLEEESIKKQLEAVRLKKKRAELTQRNQEVRMINASKIHHSGNQELLQTQVVKPQGSGEQKDRKRSQSCIDYSGMSRKVARSGPERRDRHHSNDRQHNQLNLSLAQNQMAQQMMPKTTTNQAEKGTKPRSFVDEINQLTQLVSQEIGKDAFKSTQPRAAPKSKNLLNQTAIEPATEKSLLYKKPKRESRASAGISRFIEKKKRAEVVKKSLEQTIEVDKQIKIQKNLNNLDKYVKKHMRQKSQPTISQKKGSTSGKSGPTGSKSAQRKAKKPQHTTKASAEPEVGVSEIFQQLYQSPGLAAEIRRNTTPNNLVNDNNFSAILDSERTDGLINFEIDPNSKQNAQSNSPERLGSHNLNFNTDKAPLAQTSHIGNVSKSKGNNTKKAQAGTKNAFKQRKSGDNTITTTAGTKLGTSSEAGRHRKNSAPGGTNYYRQAYLQAEKQHSGPAAVQGKPNPLQQRQRLVPQPRSGSGPTQTEKKLNNQSNPTWLARKHPKSEYDHQHNKDHHPGAQKHSKLNADDRAVQRYGGDVRAATDLVQSDARPDLSSTMSPQELNNWQKDASLRLSPKSTENIRRVHELVALYRCRFKTNVSDASIMGTLHSAASVIQIHFRYLKHLKEAELCTSQITGPKQTPNDSRAKSKRSLNSSAYINSEDELDIHAHADAAAPGSYKHTDYKQNQKEYVETTEKKAKKEQKHRVIEQLSPETGIINKINESQNPNELFGPVGYQGEKQYISSVLPGSMLDSERAKDSRLSQPSSNGKNSPRRNTSEMSSKISSIRQEAELQSKAQKKRLESQKAQATSSVRPTKKPQQKMNIISTKKRPSIDIEAVEEDHRLAEMKKEKSKQSDNDNNRQSPGVKSGTLLKTPQVPELDLKQLNFKKQNQVKEESKKHYFGEDEQQADKNHDLESQNSYNQQTVSSYRGIFNRIGLPLPRSARVKVDYDLVQKDPQMTKQLQEVVHYKDVRGRQVIEEGRRDNLITERTYEINRRRLEKWVSSSYNKIDESRNTKSAKKIKVQTQEELLQATQEERKRLNGLMNDIDRTSVHSQTGRPSGRQNSHMSQSGRGQGAVGYNQYPSYRAGSNKDENYTERDPYGGISMNNQVHSTSIENKANIAIGSGRQQKSKLVELINSSRTSAQQKKDQSASDSRKNPAESSSYGGGQDPARLEEMQIQIDQHKLIGFDRLSDIDQQERESAGAPSPPRAGLYQNDAEGSQRALATDKSLNRSQSYPTMKELEDKEIEIKAPDTSKNKQAHGNAETAVVDPNQIELQLEDALLNEQRKVQNGQKSSESSVGLKRDEMSQYDSGKNVSGNVEDIRDPRFFMRKVGEDGETEKKKEVDESEDEPYEIKHGRKDPEQPKQKKQNPFRQTNKQVDNFLESNDSHEIEEESSSKDIFSIDNKSGGYQTAPRNSMATSGIQTSNRNSINTSDEKLTKGGSVSVTPAGENEKSLFDYQGNLSPSDENVIKIENQLIYKQDESEKESEQVTPNLEESLNEQSQSEKKRIEVEVTAPANNVGLGHPVSPVSDSQAYEFKIQTGAHSLSSTDSDMAKAIHAANRDYDSPPDLISPKNQAAPLLQVQDQAETRAEHEQLADQLTTYILTVMMTDVVDQMGPLVQRPQLVQQQNREERYIKYFDQKGIKTNLFAIEKYFEEVLGEVRQNRDEFMKEVNRPLSKNQLEQLYSMQNSEIGSYDHFQNNLPPILSLDLYLSLEKRRKESRENPAAFATEGKELGPDGLFDFENVTDEDLRQDRADKNYLAECQHIHNKVLFDCINDCLQQFRPHGKDGAPMVWSRLGRKLKPTEDFTLEEMFEITKHDLYQMAITQAGTLPRREFVFGGKFDDELFAEIREKKLAGLLCREIIETEPQWLKWDFEEAQTKIDIGDMVLEALVTETIEFLNDKSKQKSAAQANFEELQEMIKQRS